MTEQTLRLKKGLNEQENHFYDNATCKLPNNHALKSNTIQFNEEIARRGIIDV